MRVARQFTGERDCQLIERIGTAEAELRSVVPTELRVGTHASATEVAGYLEERPCRTCSQLKPTLPNTVLAARGVGGCGLNAES